MSSVPPLSLHFQELKLFEKRKSTDLSEKQKKKLTQTIQSCHEQIKGDLKNLSGKVSSTTNFKVLKLEIETLHRISIAFPEEQIERQDWIQAIEPHWTNGQKKLSSIDQQDELFLILVLLSKSRPDDWKTKGEEWTDHLVELVSADQTFSFKNSEELFEKKELVDLLLMTETVDFVQEGGSMNEMISFSQTFPIASRSLGLAALKTYFGQKQPTKEEIELVEIVGSLKEAFPEESSLVFVHLLTWFPSIPNYSLIDLGPLLRWVKEVSKEENDKKLGLTLEFALVLMKNGSPGLPDLLKLPKEKCFYWADLADQYSHEPSLREKEIDSFLEEEAKQDQELRKLLFSEKTLNQQLKQKHKSFEKEFSDFLALFKNYFPEDDDLFFVARQEMSFFLRLYQDDPEKIPLLINLLGKHPHFGTLKGLNRLLETVNRKEINGKKVWDWAFAAAKKKSDFPFLISRVVPSSISYEKFLSLKDDLGEDLLYQLLSKADPRQVEKIADTKDKTFIKKLLEIEIKHQKVIIKHLNVPLPLLNQQWVDFLSDPMCFKTLLTVYPIAVTETYEVFTDYMKAFSPKELEKMIRFSQGVEHAFTLLAKDQIAQKWDPKKSLIFQLEEVLNKVKNKEKVALVFLFLLMEDRKDLFDLAMKSPLPIVDEFFPKFADLTVASDAYLLIKCCERLEKLSSDPFVAKIFSLSGAKYAAAIEKMLRLNPKKSPLLIKKISSESKQNELSDLSKNLLLLASTGRGDAVEQLLSAPQKNQFSLSLIENGHMELAYSLYQLPTFPKELTNYVHRPDLLQQCYAIYTMGKNDSLLETYILPWLEEKRQKDPKLVDVEQELGQFIAIFNAGYTASVTALKDLKKVDLFINIAKNYLQPPEKVALNKLKSLCRATTLDKPVHFSLYLSFFLVDEGGNINTVLIDNLLKTGELGGRKLSAYEKEVLKILLENPEWSLRLQTVTPPQPKSQMNLIFRDIYDKKDKKDPFTKQETAALVLSSLFHPLRQSDTGSCFATFIAIHRQTHVQGKRQILEDMIAMVKNDCLQRRKIEQGKAVVTDYPIPVNTFLNRTIILDSHLLLRSWEYTMAQMERGEYLDIQELEFRLFRKEGSFGQIFHRQLEKSSLPTDHREKLVKQFAQKCMDQMKAETTVVYHPFKKQKGSSVRGAWVLCKKDGKLIENLEAYQTFLSKIFVDVQNDLILQYPQDQKAIEQAFSHPVDLTKYVREMKVIPTLLDPYIRKEDQWEVRVNPMTRYKLLEETPWRTGGGGTGYELQDVYFEGMRITFYLYSQDEEAFLFSLLQYLANLPQEMKRECKKNPNLLLPMDFPQHVLSLVPQVFLKELENANNSPQKVLENWKRRTNEIRNLTFSHTYPPSKLLELLLVGLEDLSGWEDSYSSILLYAVQEKGNQIKTLNDFHQVMNQALAEHGFPPQEIAKVNNWFDLAFIASIEEIPLKKKLEIKDLLTFFGDTNWEEMPNLGFFPRPFQQGFLFAEGNPKNTGFNLFLGGEYLGITFLQFNPVIPNVFQVIQL